ncbi:MAG: hypothetical protein WDO72_00605 [Pseudomonadota bacterium]
MTAEAGHLAFGELAAAGASPADLEQYKLDRLLELRAVIEALRNDGGNDLLDDVRAGLERSLL